MKGRSAIKILSKMVIPRPLIAYGNKATKMAIIIGITNHRYLTSQAQTCIVNTPFPKFFMTYPQQGIISEKSDFVKRF